MMQGCPPGRGKSQTFFRNTESIVQERSVTSSAAGGILTLNPSGLLYSEGGVILRGMKAGKEEKVKVGKNKAVNHIVSIRIAILFFFANSCTKTLLLVDIIFTFIFELYFGLLCSYQSTNAFLLKNKFDIRICGG